LKGSLVPNTVGWCGHVSSVFSVRAEMQGYVPRRQREQKCITRYESFPTKWQRYNSVSFWAVIEAETIRECQ
jgi:hypothetical protein